MSDTPLGRMAGRCSRDPWFLGWHLSEAARRLALDDEALAARLGIGGEALVRLRLCRAPRMHGMHRLADLAAVAAEYGIDPAILLALVGEGGPC